MKQGCSWITITSLSCLEILSFFLKPALSTSVWLHSQAVVSLYYHTYLIFLNQVTQLWIHTLTVYILEGDYPDLFAPKTHYRNKMWIDSLTKIGPTNLLFPVFILMTYMIRHFNSFKFGKAGLKAVNAWNVKAPFRSKNILHQCRDFYRQPPCSLWVFLLSVEGSQSTVYLSCQCWVKSSHVCLLWRRQ